jgi:hypothetical protein
VLDSENVLIDGRNRLEACHRAGVGPTFEQINGVDLVAFILSSNDKRRHMIKGARAENPPVTAPEQGTRLTMELTCRQIASEWLLQVHSRHKIFGCLRSGTIIRK